MSTPPPAPPPRQSQSFLNRYRFPLVCAGLGVGLVVALIVIFAQSSRLASLASALTETQQIADNYARQIESDRELLKTVTEGLTQAEVRNRELQEKVIGLERETERLAGLGDLETEVERLTAELGQERSLSTSLGTELNTLKTANEKAKEQDDPENDAKALVEFKKGVEFADGDDHQTAIGCFTNAIDLKRDYPEAYFRRGMAYFDKENKTTLRNSTGGYLKATKDFTMATVQDGTAANYFAHKGISQIGAVRRRIYTHIPTTPLIPEIYPGYQEEFNATCKLAITDFTKEIQNNNKNTEAYYTRGLLHLWIGEATLAENDFSLGIKNVPEKPEPLLYTSRAFLYAINSKYYNLAEADLAKAKELPPSTLRPRIHDIPNIPPPVDEMTVRRILDPAYINPELIKPPKISKRVQPFYSADLQKAGIEGRVMVKATVDVTGRVASTKVTESSGNNQLDLFAAAAVRRFTFEPGTYMGKPIEADVLVPITFKIVR